MLRVAVRAGLVNGTTLYSKRRRPISLIGAAGAISTSIGADDPMSVSHSRSRGSTSTSSAAAAAAAAAGSGSGNGIVSKKGGFSTRYLLKNKSGKKKVAPKSGTVSPTSGNRRGRRDAKAVAYPRGGVVTVRTVLSSSRDKESQMSQTYSANGNNDVAASQNKETRRRKIKKKTRTEKVKDPYLERRGSYSTVHKVQNMPLRNKIQQSTSLEREPSIKNSGTLPDKIKMRKFSAHSLGRDLELEKVQYTKELLNHAERDLWFEMASDFRYGDDDYPFINESPQGEGAAFGEDQGSFETKLVSRNFSSNASNFYPPEIGLYFLGTSSMKPTRARNVSSLALRLGPSLWVFDCGEGTQVQLRKSHLSSAQINKVFITHLHGDHWFGIAGLLCAMSSRVDGEQGQVARTEPVEIIGPPGIRGLIRTMLLSSATSLTYRYSVHELHPLPRLGATVQSIDETRDARHGGLAFPQNPATCTSAKAARREQLHYNEDPGRNFFCNENGEWIDIPLRRTEGGEHFTVHAAALRHSPKLLCLGYVIKEHDYPGKMNLGGIREEMDNELNRAYFRKMKIKKPLEMLGRVRFGEPIKLHDRVVHMEDMREAPRKGRKIVILGDTNDPCNVARLASNANVLVHEATNAYIPYRDPNDTFSSSDGFTSRTASTIQHGHSTPQMAGAFAEAINCKHLILTHFSPRYRGEGYSVTTREKRHFYVHRMMEGIRMSAEEEFCGRVDTAEDLEFYSVPLMEALPRRQERKMKLASVLSRDMDHRFMAPSRRIDSIEAWRRARFAVDRFYAMAGKTSRASNFHVPMLNPTDNFVHLTAADWH